MRHFARVMASPVNTKLEAIIVGGSLAVGLFLLVVQVITSGGA